MTEAKFCSNCRVDTGLCPDCGTFWFRGWQAGKRFGVRPVEENPVVMSGRETTHPGAFEKLVNVVTTKQPSRRTPPADPGPGR